MATNTYVALQTQTLSSTATSITFSSIPQTYTDLVLVYNGQVNTTGMEVRGTFNSDAGANYSYTVLNGNGSSATSGRGNPRNFFSTYQSTGTSTAQATIIWHIQNYANASTYKTMLSRTSDSGAEVNAHVTLWRSTAAINTVYLYPNTGAFNSGSTFTLYGIAAEGTGYATGGLITSDATYYYHAFTSSGTFTPSRSLSADILVVAGGGGGGAGNGGGGGAGGLRALASQSFASGTGYTCTVGSGGAGHSSGTNGRGSAGSTSSLIGGALSISASGGGAGGGGNSEAPTSGGSGGGGGTAAATNGAAGNAGSYSPVEGYAGGNAVAAGIYSAGGGGGAGGVGANATSSTTAAGGIGATSTLIDAIGATTNLGVLSSGHYYLAGGGAGGADSGTVSLGGLGGGGTGGSGSTASTAGLVNTGGGGGGQGYSSTGAGGSGGSGLIIVRYAK
jgi:hypothetical protein